MNCMILDVIHTHMHARMKIEIKEWMILISENCSIPSQKYSGHLMN